MTSLEYIYKLFDVSSAQLGVDYVKTTPTKLQSWATKHNPPFIALLSLSESIELNDVNNNIINYDCAFVFCASSSKDPTNEERINTEVEVDQLVKRFLWFVKRNQKVTVSNISAEETFRGSSFNGLGRGLSFNLSMADMVDYCSDWCNTSTENLDCNE
tara:strand:+ start:762 stop:1235 length:474 start_codon:yes stop_codon:yes gene_type:complete